MKTIDVFGCRYCDYYLKVRNVTKFGYHLAKCKKAPSALKKRLEEYSDSKLKKKMAKRKATHPCEESRPLKFTKTVGTSAAKAQPLQVQTKLAKFAEIFTPGISGKENGGDKSQRKLMANHDVHYCTKPRQEAADLHFGKFLASAALPINLVENKHFQAFLGTLNSAYKLPDRRTIANTILPQAAKEIKETNRVAMDNFPGGVILSFDGLDVLGEHFISVCKVKAGVMDFHRLLYIGTKKEDAEFIKDTILDAIYDIAGSRDLEKIYESIIGIVGDNVGYNCAAMKMIKELCPELVLDGCVSHNVDLLCEDVAKVPELKELMKICTAVVTFINQHKYVKALAVKHIQALRKLNPTSKVTLPTSFPETRFAYAHKYFEDVGNFKIVAQNMVSDPEWNQRRPWMNGTSTKAVAVQNKTKAFEAFAGFDSNVAAKCLSAATLLKSPSTAITLSEGNNAIMSMVSIMCEAMEKDVSKWINSDTLFSKSTHDAILRALQERLHGRTSGRKIIQLITPQRTIACWLDPHTKPDVLPVSSMSTFKTVVKEFGYEDRDVNKMWNQFMQYFPGNGAMRDWMNHAKESVALTAEEESKCKSEMDKMVFHL